MKNSKNFGLSPDLLDAVRDVLAGKPVETEDIKKGSFVQNKKGYVGKVHNVSGDKSSVDIKWNKGGGSSLPTHHVTKIKEDDDELDDVDPKAVK